MTRTERHKEIAYENSCRIGRRENDFYFRKALEICAGEGIHNLKRAKAERYMLSHLTPAINDVELLVGRPIPDEDARLDSGEYERLKEITDRIGVLNGLQSGSTGHRVLDYEKLLSSGVNGLLAEIARYRSEIDFSEPDAAEKDYFYQSCEISLSGVLELARHYQEALQSKAESELDPERRKELETMARVLANVPANPAANFYEAIQSMWFFQFSAWAVGDITLTGRLDQYLYPYYAQDIAAGRLTQEQAFTLLENLYFKHNEIYGTWPASIMVGGRNRQGETVWNELSYMAIAAIETTGLINPAVSVCYNDDCPEDFLRLCASIIAKGYTKPAIFNDDVVIDGLLAAGVSAEDARYYINSTCVEITPIAASDILVATPYINLNKALEYVLNGGAKIYGDDVMLDVPVEVSAGELASFDGFYGKVKDVIHHILRYYLTDVCRNVYQRRQYSSCPLVSALISDCLQLGRDSAAGGARYHFVYPCFPGYLNLVDSLAAIRRSVYEEPRYTLEQLAVMLKTNFEEDPRDRQFLLNRCPKFGNDDAETDALAKDLYDFIYEELKQYKTCVQGTFHPSYFAWIMHGVLGKAASATPDGRLQGTALSESIGSVQGMDKNGPAAVMRSVSKLDQTYGIGGIATNFRFSKGLLKEESGQAALCAFIRTFMEARNFEAQFNVVDQRTLLDAREHPEQYQTLMVRVAGYSDYFINLDPVIQNEIICRTEHEEF